ncbi:unnamed protein product [Phytomonas sp. Hart1]|nr:unnamed protein product [Phytomonas sp. Hart1]|eukprot:CCW68079.1 unnamed protein product [Phytomonas sp. isolate Hart1]
MRPGFSWLSLVIPFINGQLEVKHLIRPHGDPSNSTVMFRRTTNIHAAQRSSTPTASTNYLRYFMRPSFNVSAHWAGKRAEHPMRSFQDLWGVLLRNSLVISLWKWINPVSHSSYSQRKDSKREGDSPFAGIGDANMDHLGWNSTLSEPTHRAKKCKTDTI